MKRFLIALAALLWLLPASARKKTKAEQPVQTDREYWVEQAYRMARPVLSNLAAGTLHEKMPIEQFDNAGRAPYAHLEAVGRLLCGLSPWFEVSGDSIPAAEAAKRDELLAWAHAGLRHAVDPDSPDYLNFRGFGQPLVDAAFLAQAFLRSPKQLWGGLDTLTQRRVITEMKATRNTRPPYNNWLMFSATVEAFLRMTGERPDLMRTDYAFRQLNDWYVGDGLYSDGPQYHNDYYNSFVMQPMLVDAGRIMNRYYKGEAPYSDAQYDRICRRASRYAGVLERSISPEGTFPPFGRSLCYRTGVFQALGQIALMHKLESTVTPAQVRCAMTAVTKRLMEAPGTFDDKGWLKIGLVGTQPSMGEAYVNTGSLYLCTTGFLPLGLPADDPFWTAPDEPWTTVKMWQGVDMPADHSFNK